MVALIVGEGRWASVVVVGEEGVNGVVGGWRVVDGVVAGVKTGALSLNIGSGMCREVCLLLQFMSLMEAVSAHPEMTRLKNWT